MTYSVSETSPFGLFPIFTGNFLSKVRRYFARTILIDPSGPYVVENVGGPMSRTRREHIKSSMLNNKDFEVRWNRIQIFRVVTGLGTDPVEKAHQCLKKLGFKNTGDAVRSIQGLPSQTLHCLSIKLDDCVRNNGEYSKIQSDNEYLYNALVLGRCNNTLFSHCGPVIWTRNRLQREVRLFEAENFYD